MRARRCGTRTTFSRERQSSAQDRLRTCVCVFEKESGWQIVGLFAVGARTLYLQGCIDRDGLRGASNCNRLHRRTRTCNLMTHVVDTRTLHDNAIMWHVCGSGAVEHCLNAS